ncbi:MAG TPA: murein biosynthesis integral membrane protein MurJ [Candidatus Limnocylindrales bacterium]|nr:murein biosynthesis integral membrane protein MurJ [Candidatus Limnocylindrales bacterium]
MTAGRTIARAGLIVSATFLASRLLGWVRLLVIANTFGASPQLDAFFAAFRIPDLIFQLVAAGALGSALIPIVSGLLASEQQARAWRVVSTVANLMLVGLLILAVVLFVAAPVVVPLITPTFDPAEMSRTIELTRIMLLSPIFLALGSVATSVLNAAGRFAAAAVAPVVYNLAIIGAAVVLAPTFGVEGLAVGVVLGSLLHLVVQATSIRRLGFAYAPRIDLADGDARTALKLMAPRALGLGATQVTFVVVTSLASTLGAGAITAYNVAFTLLQIPIGVIGVPLGTVVFPSLSREVALGNVAEYLSLLTRAVRLLIYTMVPIGALFAVLRRPVVEVLFPKFNPAAIALTADTLLLFLVGLTAHALIAVLARAFYARQDTRTPVLAAVLAVVVNTTLAIVLVGPLGLPGIALAIAIAAWIEALVLFALLERLLPGFGLRGLARVAVESLLGTATGTAAALVTQATLERTIGASPGRLLLTAEGIVVAIVFGLVYVAVSLVLRIPELPTIVGVMTDLLRRGAARRS